MANIKYEEAIRQIEEIVDRLENDDIDIDTLGPELKKAQKLIKMCKDKLTKTEEEVKTCLETFQKDVQTTIEAFEKDAKLAEAKANALKKLT